MGKKILKGYLYIACVYYVIIGIGGLHFLSSDPLHEGLGESFRYVWLPLAGFGPYIGTVPTIALSNFAIVPALGVFAIVFATLGLISLKGWMRPRMSSILWSLLALLALAIGIMNFTMDLEYEAAITYKPTLSAFIHPIIMILVVVKLFIKREEGTWSANQEKISIPKFLKGYLWVFCVYYLVAIGLGTIIPYLPRIHEFAYVLYLPYVNLGVLWMQGLFDNNPLISLTRFALHVALAILGILSLRNKLRHTTSLILWSLFSIFTLIGGISNVVGFFYGGSFLFYDNFLFVLFSVAHPVIMILATVLLFKAYLRQKNENAPAILP